MLPSCDLVKLRVRDVSHGQDIQSRAQIIQQKTKLPVCFEITRRTKACSRHWIDFAGLHFEDYLSKSRQHSSPHLSTRQYARIVDRWVSEIGLDKVAYGTHSLRRTKASAIYKETKNLRAVQILLGHANLESTVRYLGVEIDDALAQAEKIDI